MRNDRHSKLDQRKAYLQVALNSSLSEARDIINSLPASGRIIIEAGTPLIKEFGMRAVRDIRGWWEDRLSSAGEEGEDGGLFYPYVVADMKTIDRADREVAMAVSAGASAVVAMGSAPLETLNSFIAECEEHGADAMIDMMNVEYPLNVLTALKKQPRVVILHRGVDEEKFNREKQIPLHEIRRIKGRYNMMIAIAGGDTVREAQRAIFNDADIVVVWKSVFQGAENTAELVAEFLQEIR